MYLLDLIFISITSLCISVFLGESIYLPIHFHLSFHLSLSVCLSIVFKIQFQTFNSLFHRFGDGVYAVRIMVMVMMIRMRMMTTKMMVMMNVDDIMKSSYYIDFCRLIYFFVVYLCTNVRRLCQYFSNILGIIIILLFFYYLYD